MLACSGLYADVPTVEAAVGDADGIRSAGSPNDEYKSGVSATEAYLTSPIVTLVGEHVVLGDVRLTGRETLEHEGYQQS